MTSPRALIVDSGLRNRGGHNLSYTCAVQAALEARGVAVDVLASRHLEPGVARLTGYVPAFSVGAYDFPPGHGPVRDLRYTYAQSVIFAEELRAYFARLGIEQYGIVFSHTLGDFELLGWRRALRHRRPGGRVLLLLRSTPGYRRCGWLRRRAHPYWRLRPTALASIHRALAGRFTLLTDSERLTDDYGAVYRGRIVTVPIPITDVVLGTRPIDSRLHERYPLAPDGCLRIGYLGDARASKGFPLLADLVAAIVRCPELKVRFVIQCPPSASGSDHRDPEGLDRLRTLEAAASGRVTLVAEHLDDADYAALVQHLDIVLMPYRAAGYREPTSGVFAEALALGKPVVVTGETWMAAELARSGGGVAFADGDAADLVEKVRVVVTQFDEFARKAQDFAPAWRRFHNAGRLADMLVDEGRAGI